MFKALLKTYHLGFFFGYKIVDETKWATSYQKPQKDLVYDIGFTLGFEAQGLLNSHPADTCLS